MNTTRGNKHDHSCTIRIIGNNSKQRNKKMENKLEAIDEIVKIAYGMELPIKFNYDTIKEWMTTTTKNCKAEIAKQFPEVPTRVSLYEQKALEQFVAFITFVLDDGPHFSILCYTWNPEKTGDEYLIKKIDPE